MQLLVTDSLLYAKAGLLNREPLTHQGGHGMLPRAPKKQDSFTLIYY